MTPNSSFRAADRRWTVARLVAVASCFALFLVLASGPVARAGAEGADPEKALASYQEYLARKPYHDWGFDKLCEVAIQQNRLAQLITEYEEKLKADPTDDASRVVLARLLAKNGKVGEGLDRLREVKTQDASYRLLLGSLLLRHGEHAAALEALDAAAVAAKDSKDVKQVREIHKKRGEAALAAGNRPRAVAAFSDLANLEPGSFHTRLEAAAALAEHALAKEALEQFAEAEKLAGDDASKRCQVLSEVGRLHERTNDAEKALATYRTALGLMARGNWLKRDLAERILAIHERAGTLDALIRETESRIETDRQDLDAREFLARAHEAASRHDAARDVLATAVKDFPEDLALSRHLVATLDMLKDQDGKIAELQRILEKKPDELELYIDLGRAFASAGKFEQARLQWNRTLEKRLTDASLCSRLGALFAYHGLTDDAASMYEKAITLEPNEVRHYGELIALKAGKNEPDAVRALLERAEAVVADSASGLEEVAQLWREQHEPARARALVEKALVQKPDDSRLMTTLADLLVAEGDVAKATETLHRLIDTCEDKAVQITAVGTVLRLHPNGDLQLALVAAERAVLDKDPTRRSSNLVLGKALVQMRQPDVALEVYEKLLAADPDSEIARENVARLLESRGDLRAALARYEELVTRKPASRRQFLKEIARIHLALYDQDKAFACYDEILRSSPDNPAAFVEVAEAYQKLGMFEKATECLRQAVRLKPDEARNRLKLAEALRKISEHDAALEQVEAALSATDEQVAEDARKKYYALLSESGRLDATIESLRRRCEENPYDSEAPLRLTDLYSRELEYELALDLLDRLVRYQPKETRLRSERAKVLQQLERYDDAIADCEQLLDEENADRTKLQLQIADTALAKGDLERARRAVEGISDPLAVARVFARADLLDEARAAIEKGLERAPRDARMLNRLAKLKLDSGDKAGAAAVYERLLEARGDDSKPLVALGDLYHDLGRKADAIECGKRLFALVRVEEKPDEDPDEDAAKKQLAFDPWAFSSVGAGAVNSRYEERVSEIREYFTRKGLNKEFCDVGVAEMALQPTNVSLLWIIVDQLEEQKRGADALALIETSTERTLGRDRIPEGRTRRGYAMEIEAQRRSVLTGDASAAESRLTVLVEKAASRSEAEEIEHAEILSILHRDADAIAALAAGGVRLPESPRIAGAHARILLSQEMWTDAIPVIERAIAILRAKPDDAERAEEREQSFQQSKGYLLQSFPVALQKRVPDEELRRLYECQSGYLASSIGGNMGSIPSLTGAEGSLVTALAKTGRKDEAAALLRSRAPIGSERIADLAAVGSQAYALDLFDVAAELFVAVEALGDRLSDDALLGFTSNWQWTVNQAEQNHARILEKRGDAIGAYHLLRRGGSDQAAELVATTAGKLPEVETKYAAQVAALEPGVETAPPRTRREYHDAAMGLAGVQIQQKKWDAAIESYTRLAAHDPDDVSVLAQVADLHERAGRGDDVIATHRKILAKKRELNLRPPRFDSPPGRRMGQVEIPRDQQSWVWSNLRNSYNYGYGYGASGSGQTHSTRENHAAILKTHLDRREIAKATDVMRDLARDDVTTYRWLADSLGEIIGDYNLGKDGLPILRMLYAQNPDDADSAFRYAEALCAATKDAEAQKVLTSVVEKSNSGNDWYAERAATLLKEVEERVGRARNETLEDQLAAVALDPKNVKLRVKVARRLLEQQRFDEALAHATEAERLAPHLDDARRLMQQVLQATGNDAEFEKRLRDELERAKNPNEKFTLAVMLADRAYARGDRDAIQPIFDKAVGRDWGGSLEYAPSAWWLSKLEFDEAIQQLDAEIETMSRGNWDAEQARVRRAMLLAGRGHAFDVLDDPWKKLGEATSLGTKIELFKQLAGGLRAIRDVESKHDEFEKYVADFEPPKKALIELAWTLAVREFSNVEQRINELLAADEKAAFLYPLAIALARQRGDRQRALDLLAEIEKKNLASEQRKSWSGAGNMSEIDSLLAERASIFLELGRKDEAIAIFRGLFDQEDDQGRRTLATLFAVHDMHREAKESLESYLAERGERDYGTLVELAGYHEKLGDRAAAFTVLSRARVLAGQEPGSRSVVFEAIRKLHRKAGTMAELRASLEKEVAADPEDRVARKQLVTVASELGDTAAVIAGIEDLATRPEERQWVHSALAAEFIESGEIDRAIAELTEHVGAATDEWRRKTESQRLAMLLMKRGKVEEAIATRLRAEQNPYGLEAKLQVVSMLVEAEKYDEALKAADEVIAQDPRNRQAISSRVSALEKLDRPRECLDAMFLRDELPMSVEVENFDWNRSYIRLARRCGYEDELAKELAKTPDDPLLNRRAALLASQKGDHAEVERRASVALAARPDDAVLHWLLAHSLRRLGRFDDAKAQLLAAADVFDRRQGLPGFEDWTMRRGIEAVRVALGELELEKDDLAAAEKAWRSELGTRFKRTEAYRYAYYNNPFENASALPETLWSHGFDREFVRAYDELKSFEYRAEKDDRALEVAFAAGDVDGVLAELRLGVFDPFQSWIVQPQDSNRYRSYSNYSQFGDATEEALQYESVVRFHREAGRLPELAAAVEEMRRQDGEASGPLALAADLAIATKDWPALVKLREAVVAKDEWTPQPREALARALVKAERFADAETELRRAIALYDAQRQLGSSDGSVIYSSSSGSAQASARPRFAFQGASSNYYGSSWTSYSSSDELGQGVASNTRRMLFAVLMKLGKTDEAAAMEAHETRAAEFSRWRWWDARFQRADTLFAVGLFAEGEKRYRDAMAENKDSLIESESHLGMLLAAARKHGSKDDIARIATELRAVYDAKLVEDPFNNQTRLARAGILRYYLGDPAGSLAEAEAVAKAEPWSTGARFEIACAKRALGRPAEAIVDFEAFRKRMRVEGERAYSGFFYEYGRALVDAGRKDEARAILAHALAMDPENPDAAAARALVD